MLRWGILLALAVLAADQVTKALIVANLPIYSAATPVVIDVTPFLNLWHVRNSGIAFSIGNFNDGGRYFIGALAFAVAAGLIIIGRKSSSNLVVAAYAQIAGGALGNAFDRLNPGRKTVVDFIDFHVAGLHWPSFNVADSAIVVGVALILADMLFLADRRASSSSSQE
ncbi:MAG: signal peptidase II [Pseudomonadota bacterium]|nr:signal peptidase II [Pseudomonadota bacterium]